MTDGRIRVLIVDDSAFVRKVMRESLRSEPDFEVVGISHDGLDALEKIAALRPDVVTLDLLMPQLDGLGVLRALDGKRTPKVVVVSSAAEQGELVLAALAAGAVDFVHKPTALATERLYEVRAPLLRALRAAAGARVVDPVVVRSAPKVVVPPGAATPLVVIGTSTGGPQALARLLAALPAGFPSPVAVVLHIPVGYTAPFAQRLDGLCALDVMEASEGVELLPGRVLLARAGRHLKIRRDGTSTRAHLDVHPLEALHCPSVDALFESAAAGWGADVLGVVLTGMGNDGLEGAKAIRAAGGRILTEAESSCVIYGMPRCVFEAGLSHRAVPLEEMAQAIATEVAGAPAAPTSSETRRP